MTQSTLFSSKIQLRKLMKDTIKAISSDEKNRQTKIVIDHLINENKIFAHSQHIGLFLSMKNEELETKSMIEAVLRSENKNKHIYVPFVEFGTKASEMVFYELENFEKYSNEMNENNKFSLRQFNSVKEMVPINEKMFDLIIVPGLAFDIYETNNTKFISRLGRGKGYYDVFLKKIPECYTMGIGFNEQFIPLNTNISNKKMNVPIDPERDVLLNEYLCENLISNKK